MSSFGCGAAVLPYNGTVVSDTSGWTARCGGVAGPTI